MEYFDIVDENDCVIGRETRKDVHDKSLRHRAIHIFIFNDTGELFLQKRSLTKDMHPGIWDSSVSGHVDSGEEYDAAAAREIIEEIAPPHHVPLQRLAYVPCCRETGYEFVWIYTGQSNGPFKLHPEEIDEGRWVRPEQVIEMIKQNPKAYSPCFVYLWEKLRHKLDKQRPQSETH